MLPCSSDPGKESWIPTNWDVRGTSIKTSGCGGSANMSGQFFYIALMYQLKFFMEPTQVHSHLGAASLQLCVLFAIVAGVPNQLLDRINQVSLQSLLWTMFLDYWHKEYLDTNIQILLRQSTIHYKISVSQ